MASSYLTQTVNATATNKNKVTVSVWLKRSALGVEQTVIGGTMTDTNRWKIRFTSADKIDAEFGFGGSWYSLITNRLFRDTNAWYHLVYQYDSTQGTASDRVKLYINGVQETDLGTANYPPQNYGNYLVENTANISVGNFYYQGQFHGSNRWDGYISHVAVVDGSIVAPTAFGETDSTSGIWRFKLPSGLTFGNNGFHLKFENSANLGLDSSGNTNNMNTNGNLKQAIDTPSNVYATINSLDNGWFSGTFSNGNNTVVSNASKENYWTSTLGASSGKWYWEVKLASSGSGRDYVGIADKISTTNAFSAYSGNNKMRSYYGYTGVSVVGSTGSAFGNTFGTGDIIGVAMDLDNNKLYFSKNGVFQNSQNPVTGTNSLAIDASPASGFYYAQAGNIHNTSTTFQVNFGNGFFGTTAVSSNSGAGEQDDGGEGIFEYDVPAGYRALNTKNLNTYG